MNDEERTLVDRAVDVEGTDLTSFAVMHLVAAARAVLADRDRFVLSDATREAWEAMNAREPRELSGLRSLMQRPTPFGE